MTMIDSIDRCMIANVYMNDSTIDSVIDRSIDYKLRIDK